MFIHVQMLIDDLENKFGILKAFKEQWGNLNGVDRK